MTSRDAFTFSYQSNLDIISIRGDPSIQFTQFYLKRIQQPSSSWLWPWPPQLSLLVSGADKISIGSDAVDATRAFYAAGRKGDGTSSIELISTKYGRQVQWRQDGFRLGFKLGTMMIGGYRNIVLLGIGTVRHIYMCIYIYIFIIMYILIYIYISISQIWYLFVSIFVLMIATEIVSHEILGWVV